METITGLNCLKKKKKKKKLGDGQSQVLVFPNLRCANVLLVHGNEFVMAPAFNHLHFVVRFGVKLLVEVQKRVVFQLLQF